MNTMLTPLQKVRRDLSLELESLVKTKGVVNPWTGIFELPVYEPNHNVSIFNGENMVLSLEVSPNWPATGPDGKKTHVTKTSVIVEGDSFFVEELYADDIQNVIDHIKSMTSQNFYNSRQWWDKHNQ